MPYFKRPKSIPKIVKEKLAAGITPVEHGRAVLTGFKKLEWAKEGDVIAARYNKKSRGHSISKQWAIYDEKGNLK